YDDSRPHVARERGTTLDRLTGAPIPLRPGRAAVDPDHRIRHPRRIQPLPGRDTGGTGSIPRERGHQVNLSTRITGLSAACLRTPRCPRACFHLRALARGQRGPSTGVSGRHLLQRVLSGLPYTRTASSTSRKTIMNTIDVRRPAEPKPTAP